MAPTRAPMLTAIPPTLPSIVSISPLWIPARISRSSCLTDSTFVYHLVIAPSVARDAPGEDRRSGADRDRPVGLSGGEEQRRRRPTEPPAKQRRPLYAGGVHHCPQVIHPRFEIGHAREPVGHPGAALVEVQDAHPRGQPSHEADEARLLPIQLQVRDPA